jgi:integrase
MSTRRQPPARDDLRRMTPRKLHDEWQDVLATNTSGSTPDTYRRRVVKFVEWCESQGIMNINAVDGRDIKEYRDHREPKVGTSTLKNELRTVRQFLQYGVSLEAVEPALVEKMSLQIPSLSKGEESSDLSIDRDRMMGILDHLDKFHYATRDHAMMLLMWDTGGRISDLRAVDVDDFDPDARTVTFQNRPMSDTRLKNGDSSERMNVIDEETVDVLQDYRQVHRKEKTDDYGRTPLLTSKFGRPSDSTIRRRCYFVTQPCFTAGCPHGEEPTTCQYREHGHESKCPSSLSPHVIRTGRITDLRNRGVRIQHVSGRVDAIPETIRTYYDKPDLGDELERRRAPLADTGL